MPFQKGQSGNPGGQPAGREWLRRLCRSVSEDAVNTLIKCLDHEDGKVQIAAAKTILERAYGKAETSHGPLERERLKAEIALLRAKKTESEVEVQRQEVPREQALELLRDMLTKGQL